MTLQPTLDFDEQTIQSRFEAFHARHPEVYAKLCEYARMVKARGYTHYGIGALWERVRWHLSVEVDAAEPYKCNDHFRSRYARKIMEQEPDLAGIFELRALRSE